MATATFVDGWEGRVVEGRFPLLERLAGNENCGSYFTVLQGMHEAVIHLISTNSTEAEAAVVQWQFAMSLSHPHLERILAEGRSVIEGREVVYVVCERSSTNLAKTIEKGPLAAGRAKEVFGGIVDALLYLHSNGILHGHLNPSTIHFAGESPRLAINDLLIAASGKRRITAPGNYDAPELWQGEASAAVDTWSLGMTMWEAMASTPPSWDLWHKEEPEVPAALPSPFREIVRESLHLDPLRRCTLESIQERLAASNVQPDSSTTAKLDKPVTESTARERMAAAASAPAPLERFAGAEHAAPQQVDVKQPAARFAEPERIVADRPAPRFAETEESNVDRPAGRFGAPARFAEVEGEAPHPEPALFSPTLSHFGETVESPSRFVPVTLIVLALITAGGLWYMHQYGTEPIRVAAEKAISAVTGKATSTAKQAAPAAPQVPAQAVPAQTAPQTQPDQKQAEQAQSTPSSAPPPATSSSSQPPQQAQANPVSPAQPAGPPPAEGSGAGTESAAAADSNPPALKEPSTTARNADRERTHENTRGENTRGLVEKRVMPVVSPGAREGMRRPVEVLIRVSVNQEGRVLDASYVVPGPGNYFARAAQRAALSWKFKAPVQNGDAERSVWMLRFNFGRQETEATATAEER